MLTVIPKTYSFDDVLLVPNFSDIKSRTDPRLDLSTSIGDVKLKTPIISANMDTVTELQMALSMHSHGGLGIFHRFYKDRQEYFAEIKDYHSKTLSIPFLSIGLRTPFSQIEEIQNLFSTDRLNLCLDIANADNLHAHLYIKELLGKFPNTNLIVGNICTKDAAKRLIDLGVKTLKTGVGPGAACTTRKVSGHGVPQLSAIAEVRAGIEERTTSFTEYHLIADGGIKNSGDIVKAFAAGANSVMIGKMLASCEESPSPIIHLNGHTYKEYRGQSSFKFQKDNNLYRPDVTPEGESFLIDYAGPVKNTLDLLVGGIKSGMSYCGAKNIKELYEKSSFVEITHAGLIESNPHGKTI